MGEINTYNHSFIIGKVSNRGLARIDLERMRLGAEEQQNLLPSSIGAAQVRGGLEYMGITTYNNQPAVIRTFKRSINDIARLEFTANTLRVIVSNTVITRPSVTSTVADGDFSALTGWTDISTGTATAAATSGELVLNAVATGNVAGVRQLVTTASANIEHAIRIVVSRGPVNLKVGSSSGGIEYMGDITIGTGTHSLSFTPTGSYYVEFTNKKEIDKKVDSCVIESAGDMLLPTPWALDDLRLIRMDESIDVLFVAKENVAHKKIERRGTRSWSIVEYSPDDGPFTLGKTADITLTPGALSGNTTLTASQPFFKAGHLPALFRLFHGSQTVEASIAAENTFSNTIKVTGVAAARAFIMTLTGTFSGTVTLQKSFTSESSGFSTHATYTAPTTKNIDDGLDNAIVWWRIGFETGNYTSGTAEVNLSYTGGSGNGICRTTAITSTTVAQVEVLDQFSAITASDIWYEGEWSALRGYPSAVSFFDGRLAWVGLDKFIASESDAFESYNPEETGDAKAIIRNLATGGGIQNPKWMLPLLRLIIGTESAEIPARASSFDEPLTATNISFKDASTQGSANVQALKVGSVGLFVQHYGKRVYETKYDFQNNDYNIEDATILSEDIAGSSTFVDAATQSQPEPRQWFLRADGKVELLVFNRIEEGIIGWNDFVTDGAVYGVSVEPGATQDDVYMVVGRTIGGVVKYYHERLASDADAKGATITTMPDSFVRGNNPGGSTMLTGLGHLEGRDVVVWADGAPVAGTFTVTGAATFVPSPVTDWVAGIDWTWKYKSARLAYATNGTAMEQPKIVDHIGLVMENVQHGAVKYGPTFTDLIDMPVSDDFQPVSTDKFWSKFDRPLFAFDGTWDTDSRICLQGSASKGPATLLGIVIGITANDT